MRVGGVGLCHSDVIFLDSPAGLLPYELPFTLGHEIAGWIDAVGEGVDGIASMSRSPSRACRRAASAGGVAGVRTTTASTPGTVAASAWTAAWPSTSSSGAGQVVPLGDLDPKVVAPLTDAGATSYHAVKKVLPKLYDDSTVVVIGVGGLGALRRAVAANAVLRTNHRGRGTSRSGIRRPRISALTRSSRPARDCRSDCRGDRRRAAPTRSSTSSATTQTMRAVDAQRREGRRDRDLSARASARREVRYGAWAHDCDLFNPQGATIAELAEVIALAKSGDVVVEVEKFGFDEMPEAYERLKAGTLNGRAVVLPNG